MKADCQGRDGDQYPSWEGATKVWCPSGCGVGRDKTLQTREDQETLHDVPGFIFASQWHLRFFFALLVQNCKRWIVIWRMTLVIYFHGWFQASIWTSCDLLLVKIWAHHYLQCIWVPLHDMLDIKFCIACAMPSPQDPSRQLGAPVDYYKAVHSAYTNQYLEAQALRFWQAFFLHFL